MNQLNGRMKRKEKICLKLGAAYKHGFTVFFFFWSGDVEPLDIHRYRRRNIFQCHDTHSCFPNVITLKDLFRNLGLKFHVFIK